MRLTFDPENNEFQFLNQFFHLMKQVMIFVQFEVSRSCSISFGVGIKIYVDLYD